MEEAKIAQQPVFGEKGGEKRKASWRVVEVQAGKRERKSQ